MNQVDSTVRDNPKSLDTLPTTVFGEFTMTYATLNTQVSASAIYANFHAVERRAASELADALPFMVWAPAAAKLADVARHEAIAFGKLARVEFEIWGGMPRAIRVLRHVAGQIGKAAITAAVYAGYAILVAVALAYHYGHGLYATVCDRKYDATLVDASTEIMQDMADEKDLGPELVAKLTGQTVPDGKIKISLVELLPTDESGESNDVALSAPDARSVITEEPINWAAWSADDLRLACLRNTFSIPLRSNKKVLSKKQLVARYEAALAAALNA